MCVYLTLVFSDIILGWLWSQGSETSVPSVSTFWVLGLQTCTTRYSLCSICDGTQSFVHAGQVFYKLGANDNIFIPLHFQSKRMHFMGFLGTIYVGMQCAQYHGDTLLWWMSITATCRVCCSFQQWLLFVIKFLLSLPRWVVGIFRAGIKSTFSIFFALDTTWNSMRVWPLSSSTLQFSQIHNLSQPKENFGGIVSTFQQSQRKWRSW